MFTMDLSGLQINKLTYLETVTILNESEQYEKPYAAKRLNNWELPRVYPSRPRQIKCCAKQIANDDGHLLPGVKRDKNPWGNFRTTFMMPDRLTRRFADEYHECLVNPHRWRQFPKTSQHKVCTTEGTNTSTTINPPKTAPPSCPTKCEAAKYALSFDKDTNRLIKCKKPKKSSDLEYVPGDLTPYQRQHPSRQFLLEQKFERDNNIEADLPLDKLHLNKHECKLNAPSLVEKPNETYTPIIPHSPIIPPPSSLLDPKPIYTPVPLTQGLTPAITQPLPSKDKDNRMQFTSYGSISRKPNERCPSPIVPACTNFELAKRMHHENLDHQPLPDCIDDLAYRKLLLTGESSEQVLDLDPIASGMGVRTHNVGPTHCTKLKVYRPKTAAVVPKVQSDRNNNAFRPFSSRLPTRKVGAMDLAICWDYEPANPADEPQPTRHIDGSNGSASPAVFNFVKTPRDEPTNVEAGHSAGVFGNTLAEPSFFDKDTLSRKTDFTGRPIEQNALDFDCDLHACGSHLPPPPARALSASRGYSAGGLLDKHGKLSQSSPNLVKQQEIKSLREKYLGGKNADVGCRRVNYDFFRPTRPRLCHKIAPKPPCCLRPEFKTRFPCKAAFRVGLPKHNAAGDFVSSDGGCMGGCHANRVLVVPRPRNPYVKKNYNIDTLVPPFRSHAGGAGQGGYPEHWRLSSVYQHAFKPLEQRKRPMMQTVYK